MNKSVKTDLVTMEELNQILNNYRIGKKPLATLLGWGETTIIRYLEGDTPTREYSDKLLFILHNPGYFYELLQSNKGRLTPVAYRKCDEAVKSILLDSKIRIIAQYIINKLEGHISMYELQIYLFYIQGFHLALKNQEIFTDDYIINEQDMPYEMLSKGFIIQTLHIPDGKMKILNDQEKELVDDLVESLSWYGPSMLSRIINYELVLMKLSRDWENRRIISKDTLKEHFAEVLAINEIESSKQIHAYVHKCYLKLQEVECNI